MQQQNNPYRLIPLLSVLLVLLIVLSSIGVFIQDFYLKESTNWQIQSCGQDIADLVMLAPFILITSIAARRSKIALLLWAGAILYTVYTFAIYCFDVHFNRLFIVYCLTFGLAFYLFLYFLFIEIRNTQTAVISTSLTKLTGVYFIVIAALFYLLWLSTILPATIAHTTPGELTETGLFTNPVHVIDLAIFLPGTFITGLLLLKRKKLAIVLAPVFLCFFILMDITIGWLIVLMRLNGMAINFVVLGGIFFLCLFSIDMLRRFKRSEW